MTLNNIYNYDVDDFGAIIYRIDKMTIWLYDEFTNCMNSLKRYTTDKNTYLV